MTRRQITATVFGAGFLGLPIVVGLALAMLCPETMTTVASVR
jgi:hypothetical protein